MSVRAAVAFLLFAACSPPTSSEDGDDQQPIPCPEPRPGCPSWDACEAGECVDNPLYECDQATGEWVDSEIVCEGLFVDATGTLVLEQSLFLVADQCPPMSPRRLIQLSVQVDGSVTAPAPITIVDGQGQSGWSVAVVQVVLDDVWGDYLPRLSYDLSISADGDVGGLAGVLTAGCDAELEVTGEQCPLGVEQCVVHDDGWNVWCIGGGVYSDDLTRYGYCFPDQTEELCAVGGEGHSRRAATCAGDCADTTVHWFETLEEYAAFDEESLCAP